MKKKGDQKKMFSETARSLISKAMTAELESASKTYGETYHTQHEGYSVLLEEVEEAEDDLRYIKENLSELWKKIKGNENDPTLLTIMSGTALLLANEAVQIAAVCEKYKRSL